MEFFDSKEFMQADEGRSEESSFTPMVELQVKSRMVLFGRDFGDQNVFIPCIHQYHGGTTLARLEIGIGERKDQNFSKPEC